MCHKHLLLMWNSQNIATAHRQLQIQIHKRKSARKDSGRHLTAALLSGRRGRRSAAAAVGGALSGSGAGGAISGLGESCAAGGELDGVCRGSDDPWLGSDVFSTKRRCRSAGLAAW